VEHLQTSGARAILVGESLMRQENIAAKVRELSGQAEQGKGGHE
jgi:indole-3-glycerol phosphate synthase